jgi:methyltransferase family protein
MRDGRSERLAQVRRLGRTARAVSSDPVEGLIGLHAKVAERKELRAMRSEGPGTALMPWPPCPYEVDENWEQMLHEFTGSPWPCPVSDDFWELWSRVMGSYEGKGVKLGRGAFGGWGDGDPGLVRAVWCLTHHLHPAKVVETGVARGITSRFILEALARNGTGHLWSIDLPTRDRDLNAQIGSAVPEGLRNRWTYVRGSSRRRLGGLLSQLDEIDLFIHDSRHTTRNLLFELNHAWGALRPGGALVADDIDLNCGFHSFMEAHPGQRWCVFNGEPLRPDYGRQDDRGVIAIVQKSSSAT